MRKRICFLVGIFFIIGLTVLGLVYRDNKEDELTVNDTYVEKESSKHVEYEEDQILIIKRYENYAEGYDDEGFFIDVKGRVYLYDSSQIVMPHYQNYDAELMQRFKYIQEYAEPVLTLEESMMTEAMNLCSRIDSDETYETEFVAFDAGRVVLCAYNGKDMVDCREGGCDVGTLKSSAAKKFMKYFDDTLLPLITSACQKMSEEEYANAVTYYYNANATYLKKYHCAFSEHAGKYVVTNEEELAALKKLFGSEFGRIDRWTGGHFGGEIFFIDYRNVSSEGDDIQKVGIMCRGGAFDFIPKEDNIVPKQEKTASETLKGLAYVAAVPSYLFVRQEKESYFDFDGNEWIRPQ